MGGDVDASSYTNKHTTRKSTKQTNKQPNKKEMTIQRTSHTKKQHVRMETKSLKGQTSLHQGTHCPESCHLDFRSDQSTTQIREGHGTAMCQSHPTQPCRRSCVSKHVTNRPTHGPTLPYCPLADACPNMSPQASPNMSQPRGPPRTK